MRVIITCGLLFILTIPFVIGLPSILIAQQYRVDQLTARLASAGQDTARVNILNDLCTHFRNANPARATEYGSEALALARRLGDVRGQAKALAELSWADCILGNFERGRSRAQQSIRLSESINDRHGIARGFDRLGIALQQMGTLDSAWISLERAQVIWKTLDPCPDAANTLLNMGNVRFQSGSIDDAVALYEKGLGMARAVSDTVSLSSLYNSLGNALFVKGEHDDALALYRQSLILKEHLNDSTGISFGYHSLAHVYGVRGDFDSALVYYGRAADIAERSGFRKMLLAASLNAAKIRLWRGDQYGASRLFERGLHVAEELKDSAAQAFTLQSLAVMHFQQERYERGIPFLRRALEISERLPDQSNLADLYMTMGFLHHKQGRQDSALYFTNNAYAMSQQQGATSTQATCLVNLAQIHMARDEDSLAEHYLNRCFAMLDTLEYATLLTETQFVAARLYRKLGNSQAALREGRKALASAAGVEAEIHRDVAGLLSSLCADMGMEEEAYRYHLTYTRMKDSLLSARNTVLVNELSAKYEADQREKQIVLLEKDREITQLELDRQQEELRVRTLEALQRKQQIGLLQKDREIQSLELLRRDADFARQQAVTQRREHEVRLLRKDKDLQASLLERETFRRNATLVGLAALLLVTGLVFWRYREKQRSNKKLERTLGELRRTQDQLIHTEKMATLGELTAGIAHEIKNPLNFVTNFSTVSTEMVDELEAQVRSLGNGDERRQEVLTLLDELKGNMGRIHQHGQRADGIVASMLLHARSQKGVRQEADINTLLREALQLAWHGMRAQVPDFTVEIEEEYDTSLPRIEVIPQEISRVFLNVLSNAFQAVRKRMQDGSDEAYIPAVRVSTRTTATGVEVRIRDNGPGIPEAIRDKIFQPFFTTKPTGEGTGLGLSLSYDIIVKGHGGEIRVESEEGRFTAFFIELRRGEQ